MIGPFLKGDVPLICLSTVVLVVWQSPLRSQWVPNGAPVYSGSGLQYNVSIVHDGSSGAIVCWVDTRNGDADIYAQRLDAMGTTQWVSSGVSVCSAAGNQVSPAIVATPDGGAIIAWTDSRSGSSSDIYGQRIDSAGAVQWATNGVQVCLAVGDQRNPGLVMDGGGGVILKWEDQRNGPATDIYAQRLSSSGGATWTIDGVEVCVASDSQYESQIVSNMTGGAFIAWSDVRGGLDLDVYAQHVDATGSVQWAYDGMGVCTAWDNQSGVALGTDALGGVIVAWEDSRNGFHDDVYAQRISPAGVICWPTNGTPIAAGVSDQRHVGLVADETGGAILCWRDNRSGDRDIYVQRIDPTGAAMWTPNGLPLCTTSGHQESPVICSDNSGGAIVAWHDCGFACEDLYAARITPTGDTPWPLNGVALSIAPNAQSWPAIVSDGWGGVIAAWEDTRNGQTDSDVYAQRISPAGVIPTTVRPGSGPIAFVLSEAKPNPFSLVTTIQLQLSSPSTVQIAIYDVTGRAVSVLPPGSLASGVHELSFDGRSQDGELLPSGVYFWFVRAGGSHATRKIVITR